MTLVAVASLALVSCAKKELPYEEGTPELADCYGVYFPTQEAAGNHELDPAEPTEIKFSVSRKVTNGDITVPVVLTSETASIFEVGELTFADGQSESSVTVKFPNAEMGTPYSFSLAIEDPQYAAVYGTGATGITSSITRVKWNNLGMGKWREDIFAGTMSGYVSPANIVWDVEVYERDDKPGLFRIMGVYSTKNVTAWLADGFKQYNGGIIEDLVIVLDASNPNKAWIPYIGIGWQFYSNGPFYFGSLVDENVAICPDIKGYTSASNYGTYKNGIVTFPERSLCYGFSADEWWGRANTSGMFYFAIPGATPVDYSLKLASALTEDGVTPVSVTAGMDVESIKYAIYEGALTAKEATAKATAIADGSEEAEVFEELAPNATGSAKTGVMGVSGEDTGVYTLVAVTFDADGKAHDSASTSFNYVSAENPVPVVINCGLEVTGKYAPQGFTTENSLEFYVYGEDIVDAKIAVVKYLDIVSKGYDAVVKAVKSSASVSAANIAKINENGYVDLASGLVPGTEYYLFVWASNGFEDTVVYSKPASTEGDPLPIYVDYTPENYYEAGAFTSREDVIGTWNYYGIDAYGTLGMREYLGKVNVTASETETEGPDEGGNYDEYVYATGLFGDISWLTQYGMSTEATVEMDVYAGVMYWFGSDTVEENYKIYQGAKATNKWGYSVNYCAAFIPVSDGYYAFVDVSQYASSYNFCGIGLLDEEGGWIAKIWDPLLVDPAKDDNGLAKESVANAKAFVRDVVAKHKENFVETEKGRILSIIDEYKAACRNYFAPAGLQNAERNAKKVQMKVESINWTAPVTAPAGAPALYPQQEK